MHQAHGSTSFPRLAGPCGMNPGATLADIELAPKQFTEGRG
jgi:hypothetical protein